ncbi:MAG: GLPGLI family protein [Lewinellaceae bacterium]|nr:GLPGLI family protein [Lewinellaceae bacterium]
MKQLFLLATLILVPWLLAAQNTSGEVSYRETIQIKMEMPDADENLKKMIPPSMSATKILVFNESAALYKDAGAKGEGDVEVAHEEDGNEMRFVMKRPGNTLFTDLEENTTINRKEFFGRDFLITGPARACRWKLTGEKRKIGEYECQKAVLQDTSEQVVAWFTPQIPVQAGPFRLWHVARPYP